MFGQLSQRKAFPYKGRNPLVKAHEEISPHQRYWECGQAPHETPLRRWDTALGAQDGTSHCTDTEVSSSWWTSLLSKEPGQEPHPKAQTRKWLLPCRAESPWEDRFLSAAAPAPTWLPGQWEPQAHSLLTPLPPGKKLHAPTLPCLPSYLKLSGCQRGNAPALLHLPPHCLAVCEDW